MKKEIIKLGVVCVDSGQLMICDPCYIENEFQHPDSEGKADHAHDIYRHKSGKLWQYCYGETPSAKNVNPFTGNYGDIIPEYKMCPNDLIKKGLFKKTDIDPTPHIKEGEFSYRGVCKTSGKNFGGQSKFKFGKDGVAVSFISGFGDGTYGVFAEIIDTKELGRRVKKVWVELITEDELDELNDD